MPESFAWGILFDDSISGNEILQLADGLNPDLQVGIAGGSFNDIVYQGIDGLAGSQIIGIPGRALRMAIG